MYRGDKSPSKVIEELAEVIPQEREIMLTAGQQLIQQGMCENAQQIAKCMLDCRIDREIVKECRELSDEELSQISSNRATSSPSLHTLEVTPTANLLAQNIAGMAELTISREMNITATNPETGTLSHDHKRFEE